MAAEAARDELLTLLDDYHSYNPSSIPQLPYPTPLEFCKQVNKGLPCVYSVFQAGSIFRDGSPSWSSQSHKSSFDSDLKRPQAPLWPAVHWTRQRLVEKVTEAIEVAISPDGRADSLCRYGTGKEMVFLQPAAEKMPLEDLLNKLCSSTADSDSASTVYYLQSQNSNLTNTPLEALMADLPTNFDFAEAVLGLPDASNIWIGDNRSVTSTHRDPYENLYLVLKGSKMFTLWAPVDEITMDAQMVRTGSYKYNSTSTPPSFSVVLDSENFIPWVPIDPYLPRSELDKKHPHYQFAQPLTVTVCEGQMLYLPSGWYHHVSQECGQWPDGSESPCIAVNYWYDQDYEGEKYVLRQHISRLVERSRGDG